MNSSFNRIVLILFALGIILSPWHIVLAEELPAASAPAQPAPALTDWQEYKASTYTNPQWDSFVQEGFNAFDRNDQQTAMEFLRKSVGLGCRSPLVTFKLALSFESQGAYYTALQYYQLAGDELKKSHPNHRYQETFTENYARALYMSGQEQKALTLLEKSVQTHPSGWALKLLSQQALAKGDRTKAETYFTAALNLNDGTISLEDQVGFYLDYARTSLAKNDTDNAKKYFDRVMALDPQNAEALQFSNTLHKKDEQNQILELLNHH